jgi:alpha-glucoside transport system substrate-binding protein
VRAETFLVAGLVALTLAACGDRGDAPAEVPVQPDAVAPRPVISVLHPYTGDDDVTGLRQLLDAFMLLHPDVTVLEEGVRDVAATLAARQAEGAAPDVVVLSPLGAFPRLVDEGAFRPLDRIIDVDLLASELVAGLLDLGRARGALSAVPLRVDVSSLVWFNPTLFAAQGYAVPASWDELTALSDRMVADGIAPWCIGIEAGAATGWLASEWMADVLLRADVDLYDRWVTGELGSSAEEVEQALETFLVPIWTDDARVLGGRGAIATTFVGTSVGGILGAQPGCAMSRQGTAAEVLLLDLAPEAIFGVDYDVFLLPARTAGDRPVLGAVDHVGSCQAGEQLLVAGVVDLGVQGLHLAHQPGDLLVQAGHPLVLPVGHVTEFLGQRIQLALQHELLALVACLVDALLGGVRRLPGEVLGLVSEAHRVLLRHVRSARHVPKAMDVATIATINDTMMPHDWSRMSMRAMSVYTRVREVR